MIETQENRTSKDVNSQQQFVDEMWKKYNKRMHDIIDDVEIESEIEAEKKIHSKNSRLVTISIISFALLMLIFIKVQQHSSKHQTRVEKNKPSEETTFIQRKTQSVNSQTAQVANTITTPIKKIAKAAIKSENVSSRINGSSTQKIIQNEKTFKQVSAKKIMSRIGRKYSVQLGAFSIKTNAEKFLNKAKSMGFNAVLAFQDTKSKGFEPKVKDFLTGNKIYTVRIEGIETENEALNTRQKLIDQGFKSSFIR